MSLISFIKEAGEKLFKRTPATTAAPSQPDLVTLNTTAGDAIEKYIASQNLTAAGLSVKYDGGTETATVSGVAVDQATREKIVLCCGNVSGVAKVEDLMTVASGSGTASKLRAVKSGDTLSKIALDHRLRSWHPLAVANTDTVKNPDLIYIGQTLRVPTKQQTAQVHKAQPRPKQAHRANSVHKRPILSSGSPQSIARQLLANRGWSSQWSCLNKLINRESGWNVHADNPNSDAYGIPQSLPGSKMASAGSDWRDSAQTQLTWMMRYIHDRYGSPCGAWGHSQATGWY